MNGQLLRSDVDVPTNGQYTNVFLTPIFKE